MAFDRPVHAPETADGATARAAVAPVALRAAAHGGLAQMSPPPNDLWPGIAGGKP